MASLDPVHGTTLNNTYVASNALGVCLFLETKKKRSALLTASFPYRGAGYSDPPARTGGSGEAATGQSCQRPRTPSLSQDKAILPA